MADYFVAASRAEADSYIARMDTFMGYPSPRTKTTTYSQAVQHAAQLGTFLVIIKSVWGPGLRGGSEATIADIDENSTADERTRRQTQEDLEAEGAFSEQVLPT